MDADCRGDRRDGQHLVPGRHAQQVARALLEYYKLGVRSFLIRGFDPFEDTIDFGRELIPRLRAGAEELDRAKAA